MSDRFEDDELLRRLRAQDPVSGGEQPEEPGERDAVRARVDRLRERDAQPDRPLLPHSGRSRLAIGVALAAAVAVGLILIIGGSSSGPAPALAIDKDKRWVTLTLKDPEASDAEMNQELADAGIDRVRVKSVPGPPSDVGTWAGYVELGPRCEGGASRFGYDVDIPVAHPYNRANRHAAEDAFDLTLPDRSGALDTQEAGDPYSKQIVRLPVDSVDDPRNAAKILVPIRPRSPDDGAESNDIGVDQLMAFGGIFAQYGQAIEDGETACSDFGLKPLPKATFPPSEGSWVVVDIPTTEAAARRAARKLRTHGIDGKVRLIPAQRQEVGSWLGFGRVPRLPQHYHVKGNEIDVVPHRTSVHGPYAQLGLRRSAFNAFPNARWIFYVGRAAKPGERAKVVTPEGPEDAEKALHAGCDGVTVIPVSGPKRCGSAPSLQVPAPEDLR